MTLPLKTPLEAVPIQSVKIDDPSWSPKLTLWRTVTINDCLDKFDQDGAMGNFDHVARGELSAKHGGAPWFDGLIYEMIQAGADFLASQPDAKLEARLDGMIDRIAAAAALDPDGYLNTYTQMKEPTHRWGTNGGNDRWQHDLYNAGTMVDAGVHYYRATRKTKLLETATRLANLMSATMGPPPRKNIIPGHAVGEEALIGLYQLFEEQPELAKELNVPVEPKKYLELGQFWIDARGHHDGRDSFGAYDQDHIPVLEQKTIEGHAVRAALMASGLTKLAITTDRNDYKGTAELLYDNMTSRRSYLTGGVGSDPNDEKFSADFVLPNTGYAETCAAVGNCFFSRNINLMTGDARSIDEAELALFNGALSGVSLAGDSYFYENPLQAEPKRERWKWHDCPCCPPMFLKLMSGLPGMIYATAEDAVYVNQFISSTAKVKVNGSAVSILQRTRYPWDSQCSFMVKTDRPATFDLFIRIPGWAEGQIGRNELYRADKPVDPILLFVNGQKLPPWRIENGYVRLHREWQGGDRISLILPMQAQRVTADKRVESNRGKVALMCGPIVYCLESIDNGGAVQEISLPDGSEMTIEERPDLLGGVSVIKAQGKRNASDAELTAIPYFSNANRGPVSMEVWIPTQADAREKADAAATPPATAHWLPTTRAETP